MTNETITAILDHFCNEARNSLHASLGVSEILLDRFVERPRPMIKDLGRSADRLLRSIDDVRELVSARSAKPPQCEEFDLSLCVGELVEVLNIAARRSEHTLVLQAPEQLLPCLQDRRALEQALGRLLDIAPQLCPGKEVPVRLHSDGGGQPASLAVPVTHPETAAALREWLLSDPEQLVLREVRQVPLATTVLLVARRLAALGGSLQLQETSDGGHLLSAAVPATHPAASTEPLEETLGLGLDPLSVLVAEDCDESYLLSSMALQGENVWRAFDGQEAVRMIQRQRFDVVFMDIHMPGIDGYTALRSIRDWEINTGNARTPVVLLSSDDLDTQRRLAAQNGCSGFLRKPLKRNSLREMLHRLKENRLQPA